MRGMEMINNRRRALLLLFLLSSLAGPVCLRSQPAPPPEPREIPRNEGRIAVDGRLDEAAWQQALELDLPFETEPGENIPALVRTTVRVFYNKEYIYFGLECFDPDPARIRSRYAQRDQFEGDIYISAWSASTPTPPASARATPNGTSSRATT